MTPPPLPLPLQKIPKKLTKNKPKNTTEIFYVVQKLIVGRNYTGTFQVKNIFPVEKQ